MTKTTRTSVLYCIKMLNMLCYLSIDINDI